MQSSTLHSTVLSWELLLSNVPCTSSPSMQEEKAGNKDSFIRGVDLENKGSRSQKGLVSWFSRLAEGTLHVDEHSKAGVHFSQGDVHFSISDMVELKWVIEDLNGVSYRKSTLVTGFQEANQGVKQWQLNHSNPVPSPNDGCRLLNLHSMVCNFVSIHSNISH